MRSAISSILSAFDWFVLSYFLVLNTIYLVLIVIAAWVILRRVRRTETGAYDDVFANPATPGISVIIPAFNEEGSIIESTRAALELRYPEVEVVVVDDGSSDTTLERLIAEFGLVEGAPDFDDDVATIGAVRSIYRPATGSVPLTVVSKDNASRRSDALNAGINVALHRLVCCIDADSILETDALLHAVRPFVEDPDRVVATGGTIRAVNGSAVHRGRLTTIRQPKNWLVRIQIIEYLRSFLLGRTGWSQLDGLLIISGAFGVYRRDLLVSVGGFDLDSLGEDADVIASMHRKLRDERADYRVVFLAEPVCWTEVPETTDILGKQRRRWSQGLAQVLWKQRGMIGNPRYGRIGTVVLPYYLMFELFGPVIELLGIAAVVLGLAFGLVSLDFALLFAAVALLYGIVLSVAALLVEELSYRRYPRWRDLGVGVVAAVLENVGYRQLHAWWRFQGLVAALRGQESVWGEMTRSGFDTESDIGIESDVSAKAA